MDQSSGTVIRVGVCPSKKVQREHLRIQDRKKFFETLEEMQKDLEDYCSRCFSDDSLWKHLQVRTHL